MEEYKRTAMRRFDAQFQKASVDPYQGRSGASVMSLALRRPYLFLEDWLRENAAGKRLLDFGSGLGVYSLFPARLGAQVVGIDISHESIDHATRRAHREGVQDNCRFVRGDCEHLPFPDASFALAMSVGTLSYLRLDRAFAELARIIEPGGQVIVVDTLGHNPILNLNRRILAWRGKRTRWEVDHVFRVADLDLARRYFRRVEAKFFDLATLPMAPFRRGEGWIAFVQAIDRRILGIPVLRRLAFKIVCILSEPVYP